MTTEDRERFVKMGYTAAQRVASRINAGNANEFAATSLSRNLVNGIRGCGSSARIDPAALLRLQDRCKLDLSALLSLDGPEQLEAAALFGAGCMKFFHDNPDE